MPIVDISGLTDSEVEIKIAIRKELRKYFAKKLNISEDSTAVIFITDETTSGYCSLDEHVMARLYSKSFVSGLDHENMCDDVVKILEVAKHSFNEAFVIPVMAMRGRRNSKIDHSEIV